MVDIMKFICVPNDKISKLLKHKYEIYISTLYWTIILPSITASAIKCYVNDLLCVLMDPETFVILNYM